MPPEIKFPGPVPKDALDFFAKKGLKPGFDYRDIWMEEHSVAFTAAKVMELDVLATLRGTLERAIEEGTTFDQFRKDVDTLMDRSGWSDYGTEKSKKRRLRTIYDTNMRMARATGQWKRIERTKKVLPYLIYGLGPSVRHREEHVGWAGLVLPVDDPFWDFATPPSAYGCACTIRQAPEAEAKRRGISESPDVPLEPWENKRTGTTEMVPRGVQPGFAYNPGKSRTAGIEFAASTAMGKKPAPPEERGKKPMKDLQGELDDGRREAVRELVREVRRQLEVKS